MEGGCQGFCDGSTKKRDDGEWDVKNGQKLSDVIMYEPFISE